MGRPNDDIFEKLLLLKLNKDLVNIFDNSGVADKSVVSL